MAKVLITMEGGVVQSIASSEPVEVVVVDFSHDKSDDNIVEVNGDTAKVAKHHVDVVPELVEELFKKAEVSYK